MKSKKVKLEGFKVDSFVTSIDMRTSQTIMAGRDTTNSTDDALCPTQTDITAVGTSCI